MKSKKPLNQRHELFVNEYLANGMNATQAYFKAYPAITKATTAEVNAHRVLQRPDVKEFIARNQKKTADKLEITREYILGEYLELISDAKIKGMYGDGTIKDRANWAKALASITKLLGLDSPEKSIVEHKGLTINITKPE